MTPRAIRVSGIAVAAVAALAVISYASTAVQFDGGFPTGKYLITLQDDEGRPISGAALKVFSSPSGERQIGYPLDGEIRGQDLQSDEKGLIIAFQKQEGLQWGGSHWKLFWLIPIGDKPPEFYCEISAAGFKTLRFTLAKLLSSARRNDELSRGAKLKLGDRQIDINVYEVTFTLEPQAP